MQRILDVCAQVVTWVVIIGCAIGIPVALTWKP